jgi:hypothetical protein
MGSLPAIGSELVSLGERIVWGVVGSMAVIVVFIVACGIIILRGWRSSR